MWQICEKPIASYYRIGVLAIDSFWFFTGKIKDFDINGQLIMEGEYSIDGYKDGLFRFYFPNGKLMLSGKYWRDLMIGDWQWNYNNDSIRAIINFDGPSNDFAFVKYKLPDGTAMLDKGTGKFEWYTDLYNPVSPGFKVYGSFSEGSRSGSWRYYHVRDQQEESFTFEEKYDKEGNFKRASVSGTYYGQIPKTRYTDYFFLPKHVWITEQIHFDNFFRRGEVPGEVALLNYLLNRKSSEIIVKDKKVENALYKSSVHWKVTAAAWNTSKRKLTERLNLKLRKRAIRRTLP